MYGPSQFGWNFPSAGLAMLLKTSLKTKYLGRNVHGFTRWLCKFASLCWYDAMLIAAVSRSSSVMSRSLAMTSAFAFSGISTLMVGILIFVGMMASIPYVRVNGDTPVGFRLVVL